MERERRRDLARWGGLAAAIVAILPFLPGLSGTRIFYIRDLSMYFWGRHLSFRRALLGGEFPLWDPYVAGGQSAVADALRQMFLLPAVLVRLIGNEVLGFNLWVAAPYPLAAIGAWLFFRLRFGPAASALAAVVFAVSGPVVSTSNFPNMSWSVAAIPWMFWAADRPAGRTSARIAVLALVTACQALAGEPVTLLATLGFVIVYTAWQSPPPLSLASVLRRTGVVAAGIVLGIALGAVQLLPLQEAAAGSNRTDGTLAADFWSLHPVALLETVSLHLFGNYYTANHLAATPWLPLVNSDREPFLFSLYFGMPALTLAVLGLLSYRRERWGAFWLLTAAASLIGAFGSYTPVYPFLREHLPILGSFRFPAKYMVFTSLVVAAGVAAGWQALAAAGGEVRLERRARMVAAAAFLIGLIAAGAAAACMYVPMATAQRLYAFARGLGMNDPVNAVEFMFRTLPRQASLVLVLAWAAAALMRLASGAGTQAILARRAFAAFITADLVVRAWGICPAFDPAYLAEPAWLAHTRADPNARVYIGSKHSGTLDPTDIDSSGPLYNPVGLVGSASRAAVNGQVNFEPSAWRAREIISYDLPVLWPRIYGLASMHFLEADRAGRDLFLERTGVRYRILPASQAPGRTPIVRIPSFFASYLYDWGPVAQRVAIVPEARVIPDPHRQIEALFLPGWESGQTVLIDRELTSSGIQAPPGTPSATIVTDDENRVVVSASAGSGGGYLVMLDTYSPDWRVLVDGQPGTMARAHGLFRAVRLQPGRHEVEFAYQPRAAVRGLTFSAAAAVVLAAILCWPVARQKADAGGRIGRGVAAERVE